MSLAQNIKSLTLADRLLQAFQASSGHFVTVTHQSVQLWHHREGEIVRVHQARSPATLLLILTLQQTPDHLVAAVTGASRPEDGIWDCQVLWFNVSGVMGPSIAVEPPQCQQNKRTVTRETQPCCSNVLAAASKRNRKTGAFSVYRGYVHVYVMETDVCGSQHALHQDITDFHPTTAAADPFQECECSVEAMALMSSQSSNQTALLVCLASFTGFNHLQKELHCLVLEHNPKSQIATLKVTEGPWILRNVHPTTALLQQATAAQCPRAGIISVSSRSIHLFSTDAKAAEPNKRLQSLHLAGTPTAIQHLQGFCWAVADSMAELWLVSLGDGHSLCRITANIPLTITHFLCLASDSEAGPDTHISLFLGSRTDTSQMLSLPREVIHAQGSSNLQLSAAAGDSSKQQEANCSVQWLTAFDCAAPIHDAFVFQEPHGCGECRLMMGCGVAPRGSLRLAHLAAKLNPTISGEPQTQGGPKLMAVKADWQQHHHAYLAFSFPMEGTTSVLDIQGTHFQPTTVPGLDQNCPTLLLAALPGSWMVQVTDKGVHTSNTRGLVATWAAPDPLSLATSCGSLLALAHGNAVTVVEVGSATGEVTTVKQLQYLQQVSAAAFMEASDGRPQDWRDTWLAVGLWTEDMVLLQSLSEAAPCGEVDCADIGQPRSLVAADMGGTIFLCVGSSQGWVAYHPLVLAAGEVEVMSGRKVHAGISATHLTLLPAHGTTPACVYAQSSKALLLRPSATRKASGDALELIEAVRVHGGEGVTGAVGVHTPELPHSLAWLAPGGELTFGDLDHATHLRWFTLGLEDTPQSLVYHQASGHAAVISTSPSGASWLRLVHATSLSQVVALQLGKGHTATALCTARLPSSSVTALHQLPGQPAPEKEFIILASYLKEHKGPDKSSLGRAQGLLSVFEVCPAGTAGSAGSAGPAAAKCQLKLHGSCKLDSLCFSLTAAPTPLKEAGATSEAWLNHFGPQVVVAGCEGEVHMYSLFVDDTAAAGQQALATALKALAAGERLPQASEGSTASSSGQEEVSMSTSIEQLASRGWTDRVRLQLVSKAKTAGGSSLVTSLSTLDNTVLACSFMSSLSLFTTRTYQGEAGLEPLSATIGVLDTNGDISHDAPIQVQSAGLVSKGCLWAGAYPDGLLLLMRPQAELEACEARQHERQRRQKEEAASGNAYRDQVQHHQPADGDLASVQLIAGCNLQQGGTQFCRGRLGVQPLPHAAHGGEDKVQSLDAEQQANAIAHDMVVTTSDGQVFALSSIHATGQVQEVDAEAPQPDLQQHKWESSLSASRTVQLARMQSVQVDVNDCVLDTGTG